MQQKRKLQKFTRRWTLLANYTTFSTTIQIVFDIDGKDVKKRALLIQGQENLEYMTISISC